MRYINTNDSNENVSFQEAVMRGLGSKQGLYVPKRIPTLPKEFFEKLSQLSKEVIGFTVMRPYITEVEISDEFLLPIISETINFPIPLKQLDEDTFILELFHGPTMAFKDVGARFMARCMGLFTDKNEKITVLVATSGDTGSAVANGFHNVEGVRVIILYPKGKVSEFQEYQMTSLGGNITAVEVEGSFDDCQALVKQALEDVELNKKVRLSTANSINVARFLPQMIYYFLAVKQLKQMGIEKPIYFVVPSGNLGNLTAGLYAQQMGLPVKKFIAANNENDTFYTYLETGTYTPKPSVQTYSNAMDVGNPSNFARIEHLFNGSHEQICKHIEGATISDQQCLETIKEVYDKDQDVLDPHSAVGIAALRKDRHNHELGIVLGTASPKKFDSVIQKVIPDYPTTKVKRVPLHKQAIQNKYIQYKEIIEE